MRKSRLVQPNVEKIRLEGGTVPSQIDVETSAYIHLPQIRKQNLTPSIFIKHWKQVCIAALCLSLCYAIIRKPSPEPRAQNSYLVSLASLAELPEDGSADEELLSGGDDLTPVVFSGSEYQARLEKEISAAKVPAVVEDDPVVKSQIIQNLNQVGVLRPKRGENSEDLQSMVKFIAGLIAVHRPNIPDCGAVAAAIVKQSARGKVDPFLVAAIISVESRFGQHEKSHVGATGLMQLMPSTARFVADPKLTIKPSLTDITTNITLGIDYWKQLEKKYQGKRNLALAAYNWGPGNVDKVRSTPAKIPGSVQKYARTILSRHMNWLTHYQNAKASASSIS